MRINNQPETKEDAPLGRYTIRTWWWGHATQLVSADLPVLLDQGLIAK
jgi:hypothetical protein